MSAGKDTVFYLKKSKKKNLLNEQVKTNSSVPKGKSFRANSYTGVSIHFAESINTRLESKHPKRDKGR